MALPTGKKKPVQGYFTIQETETFELSNQGGEQYLKDQSNIGPK